MLVYRNRISSGFQRIYPECNSCANRGMNLLYQTKFHMPQLKKFSDLCQTNMTFIKLILFNEWACKLMKKNNNNNNLRNKFQYSK